MVQENSAATEEMSAQAEEVAASAQSLQAMAQNLGEVIGQFKLSAETKAGEVSKPRPVAETFELKNDYRIKEPVLPVANGRH